MTTGEATHRLAIAEHRLAAATAHGRRREIAAWRIAVDVLRSLATAERSAETS